MKERKFSGKQSDTFDFKAITYQKADGRATVTMNRPDVLNAVNHQMLTEMNIAFKEFLN